MHITLLGFETSHTNLKDVTFQLSELGRSMTNKTWTINTITATINNYSINFRSVTLDKLADILYNHNFHNIKGPKYSNVDWHVTFNTVIPYDIGNILSYLTWSLVVVRQSNIGIEWLDRYPLYVL